jgi:ABC-type multidrug transport system ATPase subunit
VGASRDQTLDVGQVAVSCKNLRVVYPDSVRAALDSFSYDFLRGRFYAIGGASGAGKTTLFKSMLGLTGDSLDLSSGSVSVCGPICYMPQDVRLMSTTSMLQNISYPDVNGDRSRAAKALATVGLSDFEARLDSLADNLSGGQAQRVLLARLAYHEAPIVLVDEGTSALDPELEIVVYRCLRKLAAQGACVIMIAHRIPALESADEVLILEGGKLVGQGTVEVVKRSPAFSRLLTQDAL